MDNTPAAWEEFVAVPVDAEAELDAVVSSLDAMRLDPDVAEVPASTLISLHGALLAYQLGGRSELVPAVSGFPFGRRLVERRVAAAARRLTRSASAYGAWVEAGNRIDDLISLVDPELGSAVRASA